MVFDALSICQAHDDLPLVLRNVHQAEHGDALRRARRARQSPRRAQRRRSQLQTHAHGQEKRRLVRAQAGQVVHFLVLDDQFYKVEEILRQTKDSKNKQHLYVSLKSDF